MQDVVMPAEFQGRPVFWEGKNVGTWLTATT